MFTRRQKSLITDRCCSQEFRRIRDKLITQIDKLVGRQSCENRKIRGVRRVRVASSHDFKSVNRGVLRTDNTRFVSQESSSAVLSRHVQLERRNKRQGKTGLGSELPHDLHLHDKRAVSPNIVSCPSLDRFKEVYTKYLNDNSKNTHNLGKEDTVKNHDKEHNL